MIDLDERLTKPFRDYVYAEMDFRNRNNTYNNRLYRLLILELENEADNNLWFESYNDIFGE